MYTRAIECCVSCSHMKAALTTIMAVVILHGRSQNIAAWSRGRRATTSSEMCQVPELD